LNAETANEQILVESAQDVEHTVSERHAGIESLRKENNRLQSLIRVNREKVESPTEENRKLECSLQLQMHEKEQLEATCEQKQRTCDFYQSTTAEFRKLREFVGLSTNVRTDEVVSTAVEYYKVRNGQPKEKRVRRRPVSPPQFNTDQLD
jgi:predicted nuclease with TOPRIM domain